MWIRKGRQITNLAAFSVDKKIISEVIDNCEESYTQSGDE